MWGLCHPHKSSFKWEATGLMARRRGGKDEREGKGQKGGGNGPGGWGVRLSTWEHRFVWYENSKMVSGGD